MAAGLTLAVAEMQRAGCLVFVPQHGGCREIVRNPALCFSSTEEAVDKLSKYVRANRNDA